MDSPKNILYAGLAYSSQYMAVPKRTIFGKGPEVCNFLMFIPYILYHLKRNILKLK